MANTNNYRYNFINEVFSLSVISVISSIIAKRRLSKARITLAASSKYDNSKSQIN
jgi:hypothetical protein